MSTNYFWTLRYPESTRKLAEWDQDVMDLEQVICPIDPGHRWGGKRLGDLSVILPRGTMQDFVWTWHSECLIQDHVLNLFREKGFTGFDVKPVKARFKNGVGEPPRLWELVLTGWAGLAKPESGVRRVKYCEGCKDATYSKILNAERLIDESQWDGSDFFMVWPMPLFPFITERVASFIRNRRLTGVVLKRIEELTGVGENGLGGGRLSYWMPESRARVLGEAAGIAEI